MAVPTRKPKRTSPLPREPIDAVAGPLVRFMNVQASSGVVLLAATIVALALANSPLAEQFAHFWETPVSLGWGDQVLELSLLHWINDALMVIFFFIVGLEVKRELVHGELREVRKAMLPIAAAIGGMVVPSAIYLALMLGKEGQHGWGIPMATDIAFVVGCMALFASRIPHGLRVMLLTLAIVDDIGAILVIAIGYTRDVDLVALLLAFGMMGVVSIAARLGVRSMLVYVVFGVLMWFFFHESGVHATIGGVILGLMTPAKAYLSEGRFGEFVREVHEFFEGDWEAESNKVTEVLHLRKSVRETVAPSEFLETALNPWVAFAVMPIFALANAGVTASAEELQSPVAVAVVAGLVLGKPLGIVLASWLSVRSGLAHLPQGVGWPLMIGGGCLGGIGFTMSLFLANLALDGPLLPAAKIGVLVGSALSGALGIVLLLIFTRGVEARVVPQRGGEKR
jgi:NhaA family Na+:H+ antiporter